MNTLPLPTFPLLALLPDWVPNLHPLVVHFPIGLLVVAVLLDLLQWIKPLRPKVEGPTILLYVLGLIGAGAAFWTGRIAADTVRVGVEAQAVMSDHDNWALYTLLFFGALTLLRLVLFRLDPARTARVRHAIPFLALAGFAMLWITAELGKKLVYKHGVGVAAVPREKVDIDYAGESRFDALEDGWFWRAGENAGEVLSQRVTLEGAAAERLRLQTVEDEEGFHLRLELPEAQTQPLFVLFPDSARDLSLEALLDQDDFEGRIGLVHHFQSTEHYAFADSDGHHARLGRYNHGETEILDQSTWHPHGWHRLRVAADGRHFHAFGENDPLAHGHAPSMPPGSTGLLLDGHGTLNLRLLHLVHLRESPDHEHENHNHEHHEHRDPEHDPHEETNPHDYSHDH